MEHPALRPKAEDEFCCHRRLIESPSSAKSHSFACNRHLVNRYQLFIRRIRYNRGFIAINPALALVASLVVLSCAAKIQASLLPAAALDPYQAAAQYAAQARVGGLDPNDYVDEVGEMELMANQQQIPTAQLMSAAGHVVPENFFLPGGTIPALHYQQRYQQQQQQAANQKQLDAQQVAASQVQAARHLSPLKYLRQADLLAGDQQADSSQLVDFNGYNLVEGRDSNSMQAPMELAEFLNPNVQALYEQQQQQHHQQLAAEQHLSAELAALQHQQSSHQAQQQQNMDNLAQSSEQNTLVTAADSYAQSAIGPAYQVMGHNSQESNYGGSQQQQQSEKSSHKGTYGLPTKSSDKEPSGMLKPLGNPKTVSSPVIDFVTNQLPKTSNFEKLAEKLPQQQTPTVFSFASSKDPMEKVKSVNQKKRNVMRQAEQLAKAMIKSVNDKFGTTIGDQTDIPFLLSSLGPLGIAQNILFDPSLLITLLNSAEKTYFADALPAPAKMAIRPVLNIFRVPNRKRDKANLLNIISYLASGGQTPSSPATNKNRQALGVEKHAKHRSTE